MSGSKYLVVAPDTMPGDGDLCYAMKASAVSGGVTIIAAHLVTGVAGTLNLVLQNYGTSGGTAGGTVAGMASGTATVWAADTPQSLTITAANAYLDAGEWLVIKKVEAGAGNDLTADATVCIEYVDGVVTQG